MRERPVVTEANTEAVRQDSTERHVHYVLIVSVPWSLLPSSRRAFGREPRQAYALPSWRRPSSFLSAIARRARASIRLLVPHYRHRDFWARRRGRDRTPARESRRTHHPLPLAGCISAFIRRGVPAAIKGFVDLADHRDQSARVKSTRSDGWPSAILEEAAAARSSLIVSAPLCGRARLCFLARQPIVSWRRALARRYSSRAEMEGGLSRSF
jgi:hypothetical protein